MHRLCTACILWNTNIRLIRPHPPPATSDRSALLAARDHDRAAVPGHGRDRVALLGHDGHAESTHDDDFYLPVQLKLKILLQVLLIQKPIWCTF
jgi:hypothetical protein